jgi:hypothetical protein
MQFSQDTNQSFVGKLDNVRRGTTRHFRNKNKEYLKSKIDKIQTNSKIKKSETCKGGGGGINYFKNG